ncbi:hypothetical protein [Mucilaginibacter sp.]|uniref:hypothetical protein n=1 Tax=Mucilaginibacter sp. TaxID=1882438 RepID=UPI003262DACC
MYDVHINGSEQQKATDELQKSVQGQLNLTRDGTTGNITYTQVAGTALTADATKLKNALDDHSIVVNVNATNNTTDMLGGAFRGNDVTTTMVDGKNMVVANQEINPKTTSTIDSFYEKPGANTLHEVTEAFAGAKLAQASGLSTRAATQEDVLNPNSVYSTAHASAVDQAGPIKQAFFDSNGVRTRGLTRATAAGEIYYIGGAGTSKPNQTKIIQQIEK